MEKAKKTNRICCILFIGGLAAVSLLRILLASRMDLLIWNMPHDDNIGAFQTETLLAGSWLGSYDQFTLMKGPFFSFFAAAVRFAGLSYGTGLGLFMTGASLVFLLLFRKSTKNRLIGFLAYTFILYNPAGMWGEPARRFYRTALSPWLFLIFFCCLYPVVGDPVIAASYRASYCSFMPSVSHVLVLLCGGAFLLLCTCSL